MMFTSIAASRRPAKAACRASPHHAIVLPTGGKYYGAISTSRIEDTKPLPGDRQGIGWRLNRNPSRVKRGLPWLLIDTNRWKTFAMKALTTSPGSSGALMFNGTWKKSGMERHRLLAEHYTAEKPKEVSTKERTAIEWQKPASNVDLHWWDNLVSTCAMAAERGVREPTAAPARKREVLDLAAIAKQRAAERAAGGR